MVNEAVRQTLPALERIPFTPPALPLYSAHTMGTLSDHEATDSHFWAWQVATTVYFGSALTTLVEREQPEVLLEVGPGQGLTALAGHNRAVREVGTQPQALLPARRQGDVEDRQAVHRARTRSEATRVGGHLVSVATP